MDIKADKQTINVSKNNFNMLFEIAEDGTVILRNFSVNYKEHWQNKKARWCNIADVHISGKNPDDHHFAKHTGTSDSISLKYLSHNYYANGNGNKLEFVLADNDMQVTVHYQFYTDISLVRSWSVVKNISKHPIGLEYVSSFSYTGFDEGEIPISEKIRILIPHNSWCREVNWKEYTLSDLGYDKYSKISGKRINVFNIGTCSSKEYLPMGAVENRETQNTILWQIENNGSWQWEIGDIYNMLYLKLSGPTEQENHWYKELLPSESFESVKVAVAVGDDFNSALEQMTKYRRIIASKKYADKYLPVIFNDYLHCLKADPTEEKELPLIDKAAKLGAECYCMDAGWYADGHWWDTVGEWQPCEWRFPHGIKSIFDYIRAKGMIAGLWLEIEVMGINCPIVEKFEDDCFFVRHGKRVIDHGRYQLDFRNPKVREYATQVVDRVVEEYGVGYIKNDYNIEGGIGTEVNSDSYGDGLLEHNLAYLSWVSDIKKRHPSLIWENCSSGGMRMDYANLSVADLQSVSDQGNYKFMAYISAAASTAVIPEQAAIWSYPKADDTEDAVIMNMVNSIFQRVHLSGEILKLSEDKLALVKEAIDCYKTIRSNVATYIPIYPLGIPQYNAEWLCSAYRSDDRIYIAIYRMDADTNHIDIPLGCNIRDYSILYPSNASAKILKGENGITITMEHKFSAIAIEVYCE